MIPVFWKRGNKTFGYINLALGLISGYFGITQGIEQGTATGLIIPAIFLFLAWWCFQKPKITS